MTNANTNTNKKHRFHITPTTLAAIMAACVWMALATAAQAQPQAQPQATNTTTHPVVNVNTATVEQLAYLPGVGRVMAQRIVDYRAQHGKFYRVSDLRQVTGVGDKRLAKIAPYVVLTGETTAKGKVTR